MTGQDKQPVPTVALRAKDGDVQIPQLGFGVWQVPDDEVAAAVSAALQTGYRHIDTAKIYGNEAGAGTALAESGLSADEVFLTTKVWNDDQGYDATLRAFDASEKRLGRPVDLYLIHWPAPVQDTYVDTYRALLQLRDDGRIRAAGVCNFGVDELQRVKDELGEFPAINQIELHPYLQQEELRAFHQDNGIVTEAWSPLASGGDVLTDPVIGGIAERLGRTPAQVILRWHLQIGNVVIPKSVTPARIEQNFDVFDFELTEDDLAAIAPLDRGLRTGPDPKKFG
ncbi:oxidoreductase [Flexivirga endophytica]|uniref:Oxidoreductase n=1 Tax=Flexivirga endophytica TaxID=1849103 RepID=A0A916TC84_9MICO|nr:aldo/keto reductase [Flexivirga endophytica]GGB38480.1 oxidoreductase [Flexivirga endophytica]GHB46479.1 oxidoreductase [Flexivirga endophytica]